ncbi:universal stress protein [Leifsonia sp. 21MFCrub1.1]|uniref:universal stress protein n=1 Tax=Leifsonia sp. 21MFCrub1.1 TaxID=1798223 RepID=UPI000892881F|nr:universal stress protein [Leifsonia sp. 21MFCrub1.1]SEA82156.1 Nucleotide-binding universal stress protein, UspA family [Leifsonia sp. 21MFCrub1.1]
MAEPGGPDAGAGPETESDAPDLQGAVIVGVHRGQDRAVLDEAARLAVEFGRPLLCAYISEDSYLTEWDPSDVAQESLHPTEVGAGEGEAVLALSAAIGSALDEKPERPSSWALRLLAGDPAKALGRLAAEVDARIIVVGTHRRGFSHTLENWLAGSVGAHLMHDQTVPVVVVPVSKDRSEPTLA